MYFTGSNFFHISYLQTFFGILILFRFQAEMLSKTAKLPSKMLKSLLHSVKPIPRLVFSKFLTQSKLTFNWLFSRDQWKPRVSEGRETKSLLYLGTNTHMHKVVCRDHVLFKNSITQTQLYLEDTDT